MPKVSSWSIKVLVIVTLCGVIAAQFFCQIIYVTSGSYSQWPLFWDQNRYSDYAYFYRIAFLEGGIDGLKEAYFLRPPYSFTLLVLSLPFILCGGAFYDLVLLLGIPIIILDISLFFLTKRITKSFLLGGGALFAVHFGTYGILSGSTLYGTAEAIRYQLNFLTALLPISLLAVFIAGINTRIPKTWALILGCALWSALVLRPPALPYFVVIIYPSLLFLWFLQWQRRKLAFWYGVITSLLATAGASAHLYYIKDGALRYFNQTQSDHLLHPASGLKGLLYYLNRGGSSCYLFTTLLCILIISFIIDFRRLLLTLKQHPFEKWRRILLAYAPFILISYIYLLSYLVPSSNPIKDRNLGDCFIILTVSLSLPSMYNILKSTRLIDLLKRSPILGSHLIPFSLILLCFVWATRSVVIDYSNAFKGLTLLETKDPHRLKKYALQQAYLLSNEYLKKWIHKENRKHVSVLFLAQKILRYESHSFQTLPFFMGVERAEVRVRQSTIGVDEILQPVTIQRPPAELIFVPHARSSDNPKALYTLYEFRPLTDEIHKSLLEGLPKVGYRKIDAVPISKEFELLVYRFYRPLHYQVKYGFP